MKYSFILIISFFSSFTIAERHVDKGIDVIGKASIKAEPDQFVLTVSINQQGAIASKAKALVDQKSRLVTNMYLSMGIKNNAIESARLQLTPRYEKQKYAPEIEVHQRLTNQGASSGRNHVKAVINSNQLTDNSLYQQEKIYFEVSRSITVTFTDFTLYDQLLDNVVRIGVSRISPLQTAITNNEDLYQQALINALKNANQKAETIAKQIGVKLAGVVSFEESSYHTPSVSVMAKRGNNSFNAQVAQKTISAHVNVTFAIEEEK
jgi:uncharacterized protein YggE